MTIPYRQHLFKQNGKFTIAHVPPGGYFDVLLVGGGAKGTNGGASLSLILPGGAGGEVVYKRVYVNSPRVYDVTVGQGGNRSADARPSSISGDLGIYGSTAIAAGGMYSSTFAQPVGFKPEDLDSTLGTLITDGLFYDNTEYYGGNGSGIGNLAGLGLQVGDDEIAGGAGGCFLATYSYYSYSYGSSIAKLWSGYDGTNNTGGGGGAAQESYYTGGVVGGVSGDGGSGVVIIRYPILS